MNVVLIRHFKTPGNQLGKYIGITDEPLAELVDLPDRSQYPKTERIYTSPLKRCVQTSDVLYPKKTPILKEGLKECNFGRFENKNYIELGGDPVYQKWIDSNGTMKFPDGEDPEEFKKRSCEAFADCIQECIQQKIKTVVFVVHGGTIMSIMEAYDKEKKTFYDYQVKNGEGFFLSMNEEQWKRGNCAVSCLSKITAKVKRRGIQIEEEKKV